MTKAKNTFNLFAVSEARNVIFGIATLWIGLFHSYYLSPAPYTDNQFLIDAFRNLRVTGNVGVDMFLFLSGIGLFFSFSKDSNLASFWKKRLMRVLPTAFLIAAIYVCYYFLNGKYNDGVRYFFSRISFLNFYIEGERVFWFISLILALYIVFPLFYKVIEKYRGVGTIALVAAVIAFTMLLRGFVPGVYDNVEIALCRVPVFIIGIWAGRFVMEKREISMNWLFVFLGVAVVLLVFVSNFTDIMKVFVPGYDSSVDKERLLFLYRYASCPLGISLVVLDSYLITTLRRHGQCNLLRNFLEFVGMYSMEYYMIYLNLNSYLERTFKPSAEKMLMMYCISFIVSLVLCVMVRKVCDFFMAYMQRKPKNPVSHIENGMSMKWYDFLLYVGLFVVIAINGFVGIMELADGNIVIGIFSLLIAALGIVARISLARRRSYAPMLTNILIVTESALLLSDNILDGGILSEIFGGGKKAILLTVVLIGATVFLVLQNKKYFDKRIEMFDHE